MHYAKLLSTAPILVTLLICVDRIALAQLTEVEWGGTTGIGTWQDNANWIGGVFPNDSSKIANLSVDLAANLTVRFGATDISIAGVRLGGTSAPVTTSIISSGGRLLLGGTTSTIETAGVAGSVNEIGAPIRILNQKLVISSPNMLTLQGPIEGAGELQIGNFDLASPLPIGTVRLANANLFAGSVQAGRGTLILGHDDALGKVVDDNGTPGNPSDDVVTYATYQQTGAPNQFGYNLLADEDRTVANDIIFAGWQTIKGEHSIELTGSLTQTRNRGIINLLPASASLTISGDLNIWEDDESIERRFVVDGTGKTRITGVIRDDILGTIGQDRRLQKTGTGVLVVDTAAGDNNHSGPEVVLMGNWHFADNNSLNVSSDSKARILSLGGAVGVDSHPGAQSLATNSAFLGRFDPSSTGGLMLAPTDANTNINFSAAALSNVRNMSLAAPEGGITYTGTIAPFAGQYRLGGGAGTLTLPNDQLTSATRSLSVRNGGIVRLLGNNSYGGPTVVESRYGSTNQELAAADSNNSDPTQSFFLDRLVAPVLEINTLANGGVNSSIGASSNAAANLRIHGSTLRYVGAGSTTDRLFTIGTAGATLDASGSGPLVFSNLGAAVTVDAADISGTLDDFSGSPSAIYNVSDSRDVVIGMSISDPDPANPLTDITQPPCAANGANCIPLIDPNNPGHPVTVTSVSSDGKEIGISANYPFVLKQDTRLVLGPVDRTLTLSGTNAQPNVLHPVISNSPNGGRVNIVKTGSGMWLLEGNNTTTGTTTVEQGTLGGNGGVAGSLAIENGATFAPGAAGGSSVGDFSVGADFVLASNANLSVQIAGLGTGNADLLSVAGSATLSGNLSVTTLAFSPAVGNRFVLLTAVGGVVGSFASSQLPMLAPGLAWAIQYDATSVSLEIIPALSGDYNGDGTVDAADYTVWRDNLGSATALPNDDTPGVGADDYTRWKAHFGETAGSGAGQSNHVGVVPEPTSFALIALATGLCVPQRAWALRGTAIVARLAGGRA